jgi:Flp pilus assembly protein TadG
MSRYVRDFRNMQKGAALVEFAIVVPLLLLLVVGISEFSYAYYHLNMLNKSVQDGARYFSDPQRARNGDIYGAIDVSTVTNGNGNGANITKAQNLVKYGSTATGTQLLPDSALVNNISVPTPIVPTVYCAEENTSNSLCAKTTHHIRVTATYNHYLVLANALNNMLRLVSNGGSGNLIPNPYPLTASSVLRVE